MSHPVPTITAYLDLAFDQGDVFTLDDPVKGVLDGTTYTLSGDTGSDLSDHAFDIRITRGRANELATIGPGTARVSFRNHDRMLDPMNESSALFASMRVGRRCEIAIYNQTIFSGFIEDWEVEYSVDGETAVYWPLVDAMGALARKEMDEFTSTAGETAGQRITSVLDRPEVGWPGASRDLDPGVSVLQADLVSWGSNVLSYLQLVAMSDLGHLFADRWNVVTYRDRQSLWNPADPTLVFKADGTGVRFHGARVSSGAERFFNRVGIDRAGGMLQTAEDAASVTEDGVYNLSIGGLLMDSDDQAEEMAEWLLSTYQEQVPRISQVTVILPKLPDDGARADLAALDINDVVGVEWQPFGLGSTIEASMRIEGIEHSIPFGGPHVMTLMLAPVSGSGAEVFILDDAVFGVLDGSAILAF